MPTETAETCIETHLSHVTLLEDRVFKRLKPVSYPFVDFSTLDLRQAACRAELAHNRPWAPGVYLRVAPVAGEPPRVDGAGVPVDYAIVMRRLPDEARLRELGDALTPDLLETVGSDLRKVHDRQPVRPAAAMPDEVERRMWENLTELLDLDAAFVPDARLRRALAGAIERAADALAERADSGRLLHGDLRTEHVYRIDGQTVVLDGVAFNPSLAEGDPVEDIAFLGMELAAVHGRWDLEDALWRGWSGGAPIDPALVDLYTGHRSLIRAKVNALQGRDARAAMHVRHALARLESPANRPALVGVGGLPGVGKSTLSGLLERFLGFRLLRSDVLRKRHDSAPCYSLEARDAVYTALFAEAAAVLERGERLVVDASFGREAWREGLLEVARRAGVRPVLLFAHADERVVAHRLVSRMNDPSDADFAVHQTARRAWESLGPRTGPVTAWIDTGTTVSAAFDDALEALADVRVADPSLTPSEARTPDPRSPSERSTP